LAILIFAPFLTVNLGLHEKWEDHDHDDFFELCGAFMGLKLPCKLLYSRITLHMALAYSLTLAIYAVYRLVLRSVDLIRINGEKYHESYQDDSRQYKLS